MGHGQAKIRPLMRHLAVDPERHRQFQHDPSLALPRIGLCKRGNAGEQCRRTHCETCHVTSNSLITVFKLLHHHSSLSRRFQLRLICGSFIVSRRRSQESGGQAVAIFQPAVPDVLNKSDISVLIVAAEIGLWVPASCCQMPAYW